MFRCIFIFLDMLYSLEVAVLVQLSLCKTDKFFLYSSITKGKKQVENFHSKPTVVINGNKIMWKNVVNKFNLPIWKVSGCLQLTVNFFSNFNLQIISIYIYTIFFYSYFSFKILIIRSCGAVGGHTMIWCRRRQGKLRGVN